MVTFAFVIVSMLYKKYAYFTHAYDFRVLNSYLIANVKNYIFLHFPNNFGACCFQNEVTKYILYNYILYNIITFCKCVLLLPFEII